MNKREKILAGTAGLVGIGLVTYFAVNNLFLQPAADCLKQTTDLREKIRQAETQRKKEDGYRNHLKDLAALTFGSEENRVSAQVRTAVTDALTLSGLGTQNLSMKPLAGSRVPGVHRELGWSVRARGKLAQVISFLFLMTREPHLHRLDNLVVAPVPNTGDVEVTVKYATLLLEAPKGEKFLTDDTTETIAAAALQTPERQQYDVIATRDLFRPYIPRKPPPPEGPPRPPSSPSAPSPPSPRMGDRVVGLPTLGGQTEVAIYQVASGKVVNLKPGDELAGGKIIMVDYRPLPSPKNPLVLSESRVVLQIGGGYYAVEVGQPLVEKRPLAEADLPPGLPKLESVPPAAPTPATGTVQQ